MREQQVPRTDAELTGYFPTVVVFGPFPETAECNLSGRSTGGEPFNREGDRMMTVNIERNLAPCVPTPNGRSASLENGRRRTN